MTAEIGLELLKSTPEFAQSTIKEIIPLTPNESPSKRRYYRLLLTHGPVESVVLMELSHGLGHALPGTNGENQDDTFVEMCTFLNSAGLPVPQIYVDARARGYLLVEDVGSVGLWQFATGQLGAEAKVIAAKLGSGAARRLMLEAVDIILKLQKVKVNSKVIGYRRWCDMAHYRKGSMEFMDYVYSPKNPTESDREIVQGLIDDVSTRVAEHPKSLVHFDYMGWNLFVSPGGQVRVLDFQDACQASCVRDIVSLINDRGMDTALGPELHKELLQHFIANAGYADTERMFLEHTLQWDLRVAGRFHLFVEQRGMPEYAKWIPGYLARIKTVLTKLPQYHKALESISRYVSL